MGNYITKLLFHTNENQKESNEQVKQQVATDNSTCTPLSEKKMLCDPRSVSAEISRTPIELATQDSMCTPKLSDKTVLCDPRSISAGIARTPIEAVMQENSTLPAKRVLCDPRSISIGILRTPIEVECTPTIVVKRAPSAIPEYLQTKKYLETDMDVVMPPLTPKKRFVPKRLDSGQGSESDGTQGYLTPIINEKKRPKSITPIDKERYTILGLDPRSPAADFDRTPILMPKSIALIKARQEALSRRDSYESEIYNPTNSHREISTSVNIPKIQLLSDTSEIPKTLDMEEQCESHVFCTSQQSDSDSSVIESEEEITIIKNPKCKNETEKSLISGKQTVATDEKKNEDTTKDNCKDIEHDMKTMHIKDDSIEVWYDSISSEENITGKEEEKNIVETLPKKKTAKEDIIIMFDDCTTTSTLPKPIKIEEDCQKKGDIGGRKKKTKIDATPISNEKKIFSLETKISGTETLKNRTPFGNRSNNDPVQIINSPQHLSRNKTVCTKTQQENTPPCKMNNAKTKNGRHWDPNTTVFI
ncbi:uncharacterized protein [Anoplolepis gracilipes]|uniref:uncharacterized protein isoform X2 n=1 Tax=Anoplolepis gracilipes TaxID=354296 RepID=UPI003BA37078